MRYSDLTSRRLYETILYRGDASKIDKFETGKTGFLALFGKGIYLTDNPEVAADYTFKGSDDFTDEEAQTPKELITAYIVSLVKDDYQKASDAVRSEWMRKHDDDEERVRIYRDMQKGMVSYNDPAVRAKLNAITAHYEQEHTKAQKKLKQQLFAKARAKFKAEMPNLRIVTDTTGKYRLVKKGREGYVTTFDIPEDYLARTLPGDDPLPDDVLHAIKELFLGGRPDSTVLDMRDAEGNFMTFDDWVSEYRTKGVDYAWRDEDRVHGGKGENPNLDAIWNGTHGGFQWFYSNLDKFIAKMQEMGYVGIQYHGGTRMGTGGMMRGGGGIKHRAFVFWNDDEINRYRIGSENISHRDPEIDPALAKGVRAQRAYWPVSRM